MEKVDFQVDDNEVPINLGLIISVNKDGIKFSKKAFIK